jgi:hypothetical protein
MSFGWLGLIRFLSESAYLPAIGELSAKQKQVFTPETAQNRPHQLITRTMSQFLRHVVAPRPSQEISCSAKCERTHG